MQGIRKAVAKLDTRISRSLPEKSRKIYNHPAGPRTVHFWGPAWKGGMTLVGASDFIRPPDKLSTVADFR